MKIIWGAVIYENGDGSDCVVSLQDEGCPVIEFIARSLTDAEQMALKFSDMLKMHGVGVEHVDIKCGVRVVRSSPVCPASGTLQ